MYIMLWVLARVYKPLVLGSRVLVQRESCLFSHHDLLLRPTLVRNVYMYLLQVFVSSGTIA